MMPGQDRVGATEQLADLVHQQVSQLGGLQHTAGGGGRLVEQLEGPRLLLLLRRNGVREVQAVGRLLLPGGEGLRELAELVVAAQAGDVRRLTAADHPRGLGQLVDRPQHGPDDEPSQEQQEPQEEHAHRRRDGGQEAGPLVGLGGGLGGRRAQRSVQTSLLCLEGAELAVAGVDRRRAGLVWWEAHRPGRPGLPAVGGRPDRDDVHLVERRQRDQLPLVAPGLVARGVVASQRLGIVRQEVGGGGRPLVVHGQREAVQAELGRPGGLGGDEPGSIEVLEHDDQRHQHREHGGEREHEYGGLFAQPQVFPGEGVPPAQSDVSAATSA